MESQVLGGAAIAMEPEISTTRRSRQSRKASNGVRTGITDFAGAVLLNLATMQAATVTIPAIHTSVTQSGVTALKRLRVSVKRKTDTPQITADNSRLSLIGRELCLAKERSSMNIRMK